MLYVSFELVGLCGGMRALLTNLQVPLLHSLIPRLKTDFTLYPITNKYTSYRKKTRNLKRRPILIGPVLGCHYRVCVVILPLLEIGAAVTCAFGMIEDGLDFLACKPASIF